MDWRALAKVFPRLRVVTVYFPGPLTAAEIAHLLQLDLSLHRLVLDRPWSGNGADARRALRDQHAAFDALVVEVCTMPATFPELALQLPWNGAPKPEPLELRIEGGRYQCLKPATNADSPQ
jgi:hypothetical protein